MSRYVEAFWSYSASENGSSLILPDGRCDVILRFNARQPDEPIPIVTGPATEPFTVDFVQGDSWLGIRFRPQYGVVLWRRRITAAVDKVLLGKEALALLPELNEVIEGCLTIQNLAASIGINTSSLEDNRLLNCLDVLHTSGGRIRVDRLAQSAGCTPRQLNRIFRTNTGLTTKTYSQLVQFHRTVKLIQVEGLSITDAAFEGGYSDHAHLTRAFKRFGGFAPSRVPRDLSLPGLFN